MTPDLVAQLVGLILSLILPFVQEKLNDYYKLNGDKALALTGLLSALVAVGVLLGTGQISLNHFDFTTIATYFLPIYTMATVVYNLVKDRLGWTKKAY